jgi:hypothetical protein
MFGTSSSLHTTSDPDIASTTDRRWRFSIASGTTTSLSLSPSLPSPSPSPDDGIASMDAKFPVLPAERMRPMIDSVIFSFVVGGGGGGGGTTFAILSTSLMPSMMPSLDDESIDDVIIDGTRGTVRRCRPAVEAAEPFWLMVARRSENTISCRLGDVVMASLPTIIGDEMKLLVGRGIILLWWQVA